MFPDLDALPVHDELAALDMLEGERELLEEIISLFRESTVDRMVDLSASLDAGDVQGVSAAAHSIKGAAANICAERIRSLSTELESMARRGELDGLTELVEALVVEVDRFDQEVSFTA